MKTKKINIKLVIIAIISVLILGGATTFGLVAYSNFQTQQKIDTAVGKVADKYASFEISETEEEKFSILEDMISEYESFVSDTDSENYFEEVKAEYEKSIALMRKYFTDGYDLAIDQNTIATLDEAERDDIKASITNLMALNEQISKGANVTIADEKSLSSYNNEISKLVNEMRQHFANEYDKTIDENTLGEIEKITDKEKLNVAIKNLDELNKLIENESDITLADDKKADEYKTTTNNLVESYEDRIEAIEIAEAQAKKQEEEKEEDNNNESSTSNSNNSSNNSSSNNSSSNNSSSNNSSSNSNDNSSGGHDPNHGGLKETRVFDNGIIIYYYNDGCAIQSNGNNFNWKDIWEEEF